MIKSQSVLSSKQLSNRNSATPNIFLKPNLFFISHLKSCMHKKERVPKEVDFLGLYSWIHQWSPWNTIYCLGCHTYSLCSKGNLQSHLPTKARFLFVTLPTPKPPFFLVSIKYAAVFKTKFSPWILRIIFLFC